MSDTARPAATGVLSTEQIRAHFPALQREHGGRPVAYFDGPGGTQVPREVVEAVSDYLYHHHANVAPWQALARERGVRLRVVRMDTETGALDWEDFEGKVNERTRLVAVGA